MRRRIKIRGLSVHRHALPQLLGGRRHGSRWHISSPSGLFFEGGRWGSNDRYGHLFDATIVWAIVATPDRTRRVRPVTSGLWKFIGQRDYEAVLKAVNRRGPVVIVGRRSRCCTRSRRRARSRAWHTPRPPRSSDTRSFPGRHAPRQRHLPVLPAHAGAAGGPARFIVQLISDGRIRSIRVGEGAREGRW